MDISKSYEIKKKIYEFIPLIMRTHIFIKICNISYQNQNN